MCTDTCETTIDLELMKQRQQRRILVQSSQTMLLSGYDEMREFSFSKSHWGNPVSAIGS